MNGNKIRALTQVVGYGSDFILNVMSEFMDFLGWIVFSGLQSRPGNV